MHSNASILITGATGFVGANLCRYFLKRGYTVAAVLGRSNQHWRQSSFGQLEPSKLSTHYLDLCDEKQVSKLIQDLKPNIILNCAAYGAYSNQKESNRIYNTNFDSVRYLLESANKLDKFDCFIQAGSSSEYGKNCNRPDEDALTIADSDYSVSKIAATQLIRYYGQKFNFPAWVFRLYSVFGPLEDTTRLVPNLLIHGLQGKLPPLVNPNISRDFIYVDDVCEAFEKLILSHTDLPKGGVYNIGSGEHVTLGSIVETVRSLLQVNETPQWGTMPNRHWDHNNWCSNPGKAQRDFAWTRKTSLIEGLQATVDWIRDHPEQLMLAQKNNVLTK